MMADAMGAEEAAIAIDDGVIAAAVGQEAVTEVMAAAIRVVVAAVEADGKTVAVPSCH
jgi:hypothetical protein